MRKFLAAVIGTALALPVSPTAAQGAANAVSVSPRVSPAPAGWSDGWSSFARWTRTANGQVTARIYPVPQFTLSGGRWRAVDTTVRPTNDHGAAAVGMVRPISFGTDNSHLLTLGLEEGPVTISAPDMKIRPPVISAGTVSYRSVAPDTDLWYRNQPGSIVEDIVLQSPLSPTSYRFHISDPAHALGTPTTANGGVQFQGLINGDIAVALAAPFAYQEKAGSDPTRDKVDGKDPNSAHLTFSPAGDGWDVSESVDAGWLKKHAYPIVLDPTVTFSHAGGTMVAGTDDYVPSGCGGSCTPNTTSSDLDVGTYTDSTYDWEPARSVFRFDLSSIPAGSQITSATFGAYTIGCVGNPAGGTYYCGSNNYTVELHQLDGLWDTSSTYNQIAALTDSSVFSSLYQPAFNANFNPPCTGCFWETFDVTNEAQSWVNSSGTNYGFVAKLSSEPYSNGGPGWSYLGPQGGGNGYPSPYLQVTFVPNSPTTSETYGAFNPAERGVSQCSATVAPVDCATGNFYHTFTDLTVPGRGPNLDLSRSYNSLAASTNSPFGFGWSSSYTMSLTIDSNGNATIAQENGSTVTFTATSGGAFIAPARVTATLVHNADGTYTFVRAQRERFTFSSAGQLLRESDLNGYTTTLSYSGTQLAAVADPSGRVLSFNYGANGDISSATDSAGRQVVYTYDSAGNLQSVRDIGGGLTRFTYDASHLLLTMTDPRGGVTTNTYNASGQVLAQTDPMSRTTRFSYGAASTTITDPMGNVEVQDYSFGLMTSLTKAVGTSLAATWTYQHSDPCLAPSSVTDPNGHLVTATYDQQCNLLDFTDALGNTTKKTYDPLNDLTSITDPLGHLVTYTYDAEGNRLTQSQTMVETGHIAQLTYAYGDPSHPGDVTRVTDPSGVSTTFGYDAMGNLVSRKDGAGGITTYAYDQLGRVISSVSPNGNAAGGSPTAYTTSYTYDPFGDLLTTTNPLGQQSVTTYDPDQNQTSSTDAHGKVTTYTYDLDNEITQVTRPDGNIDVYAYDGDGNQTSVTDGNGHVISYGYDALNHMTSITDPLGRPTRSTYDAVGDRLTLIDPSGRTTSYAYNSGNELTTVSYSDPATPGISLSYNADHQLISEVAQFTAQSGSLTREYSYDSLGRLAATSELDPVLIAGGSLNELMQAETYGYDLAGRETSLGVTVSVGTLANTVSRTFSRTYDNAGRMSSVSDGLGNKTTFGYDSNGNLTSIQYPNRISASLTYDAADQTTRITDSLAGAAPFLDLPYSYGGNGEIVSQSVSGVPMAPAESVSYDSGTRVTSTNIAGQQIAGYGYDLADNLTTQTLSGLSETLSYDAADELTSVSNVGGQSVRYAYDLQGNRTSAQNAAGLTARYGFDQANRLVSFSGSAVTELNKAQSTVPVQQAGYSYDIQGLRTDLSWDRSGTIPLVVGDLSGATYLTGPSGLPVERIDQAGNAVFYHQDALGSTRAITSSSGTALVTYSYTDYGVATASGTAVANPFQFAGGYTDAASGLVYLRSRWYDPTTGQFLSRDPLTATTAQPYSYASDDPVNLIDPLGWSSSSDSFLTWFSQQPPEVQIWLELRAVLMPGGQPIGQQDNSSDPTIRVLESCDPNQAAEDLFFQLQGIAAPLSFYYSNQGYDGIGMTANFGNSVGFIGLRFTSRDSPYWTVDVNIRGIPVTRIHFKLPPGSAWPPPTVMPDPVIIPPAP